MNTIHIFYNGTDYKCPSAQEDIWSNYIDPNNPRLFLACAASWERKGWQVRRISTEYTKGFKFKGHCLRDLKHYPQTNWDLWFELRRLAPCLCVNMNVFNTDLPVSDEVLQSFMLRVQMEGRGISMHQNGWSASCCYVTKPFVEDAIDLIYQVDRGQLAPPKCDLLIDDKILQRYGGRHYTLPWCGFPFVRSDWQTFKLLHFSRSTITRAMDAIPLI